MSFMPMDKVVWRQNRYASTSSTRAYSFVSEHVGTVVCRRPQTILVRFELPDGRCVEKSLDPTHLIKIPDDYEVDENGELNEVG